MSAKVKTLTGYIKPKEVKASKSGENTPDLEEREDDDKEIDEDDFMEMDEITAVIGGAFHSHSRPVACRKVNFLYEGGEMLITGPFLFTDIWWQIEVDVLMSTKNVQHTPRYRIKSKWEKQDIDQYLMQCNIPPKKREQIWAELQRNFGTKDSLSVSEILKLIFLKKLPENSAITPLIRRAQEFPHLFWKLQAILPKKTFGILTHNLPKTRGMTKENSNTQEPDFEGLNKAVVESPWKFAFSWVLYKGYQLSGCEAKLSDLKKSGVFHHLDDVKKDSIIVYDKLKQHCCRNGHTYMNCPVNTPKLLFHKCTDRFKTQTFLCSDQIRAAKCEPRRYSFRGDRLFLRKYWEAETTIACNLKTIMGKGNQNRTQFCLPPLDGDDWKKLDKDQKVAVEYIRTKRLTVLSGKGGCGKTTVVSKLVTKYDGHDSENGSMRPTEAPLKPGNHCILLTAPTGKAASSLGKKCGLPAYTIHSVIYSHMNWKQLQSNRVKDATNEKPTAYEENCWIFAKTKMLVVDECSMVAVTTFNRLLQILLDEASLCKVVLLGDIRQLPSVEPGNFFEDVYHVASKYDFGVELKTNHRVDAGGRSIAENTEKISKGKMPKFDKQTFELPNNDDSRFVFLEVPLEEGGPNDDYIEGRARKATIDKLKELLESTSTEIEDVNTSQIITFTRKLVTYANNVCAQHYNAPNEDDNREHSKLDFRVGDKICCRKNCQMENPFYDPRVGDSNTGAGFPDGNHLNRAKKDNDLSSEEALKLLNGNQETIMTADNSVLSSNNGGQFAMTPLQQEENREETEGGIDEDENVSIPEEGELKNGKIDRTEQVLNRELEKDKNPKTSNPRVSQDERKTRTQKDVPQQVVTENECGETNNEKSYRFLNGETFIIRELKDFWNDGTSLWKTAALLDDMESNKRWVNLSAFRRTGKAQHAWCRTIHTFQGSEVKTVVYLISSTNKEFRKHVYTAVTRGKEKVIVIGARKYLLEALKKDFERTTGLKGFFQDELEESQRYQMSNIEGRKENASVSAKCDTEIGEGLPIIPGGGLKNTEVNGYDDSHLHEEKSICTEEGDGFDNKDSLPSVSYQSELVTRQSPQNDKKQTTGMSECKESLHSTKSTSPTSLSGTKSAELRDIQHRQVLSVERSTSPPPPPLTPPPPPPPARILTQEAAPQKRKISPERPKQEDKHVKRNRSHQTILTDFYRILKSV